MNDCDLLKGLAIGVLYGGPSSERDVSIQSGENVAQALAICDRAYVLETGRIVATGAAAELARSPALRRAFLGVASGG